MTPRAVGSITLPWPQAFCHLLLFSPASIVPSTVGRVARSSWSGPSGRYGRSTPLPFRGLSLPRAGPSRRGKPCPALVRTVLSQDREYRMATVTALGVCPEIASVMPTGQRLRQLELVERWRRRNFLPVFCDSRYPTNFSYNAVPAVGRWGNVVIQPVAPVRLGQLVHPDPRQRAMSSRSLMPHRFRIPLMPLRLTCNLMCFLPSQNVPRY